MGENKDFVFYCEWIEENSGSQVCRGLTKRELMAALMVHAEVCGRYASGESMLINVDGKIIIEDALKIVDALFAALNKPHD